MIVPLESTAGRCMSHVSVSFHSHCPFPLATSISFVRQVDL